MTTERIKIRIDDPLDYAAAAATLHKIQQGFREAVGALDKIQEGFGELAAVYRKKAKNSRKSTARRR